MFRKRHSSRRVVLALLTCLTLVFAVLPGSVTPPTSAQSCPPGDPPHTPGPRSFVDFITLAYAGVGRTPTCFQVQIEYDNLHNAYLNNTLLDEARRFVATLVETQASYNDPGSFYQQTTQYQARRPLNPNDPNDLGSQATREAFVTDLYHAFLQREPEAGGLCFWQNENALFGRKYVLHGFVISTEFSNLVNNLFPGDPPDCGPCGGITCPFGTVLDAETCNCRPNCEGPNNGGYSQLCF